MNPWQYEVPPVLYKYLGPTRVDVLTSHRIRFSQRTVFKDEKELQPDYRAFGTVDEIERHIHRTQSGTWGLPPRWLASLIAINPAYQKKALNAAVKNIKSIDAVGMLCLTADARSEAMWNEYAEREAGFVVGFDTTHEGFQQLTAPRGVGKVSYTSDDFPTFLGMIETNPYEPLFRKRPQFSYEEEWRSIRLLKDLESHPNDIFLASFDLGLIREIVIGRASALEPQIREIVARDEQLRQVQISSRG